jgi:hypothetical protein
MDLADDDEMKLLCHHLQCGGLEITEYLCELYDCDGYDFNE